MENDSNYFSKEEVEAIAKRAYEDGARSASRRARDDGWHSWRYYNKSIFKEKK